jgi:hypothetical protein
VRLDREKRSGGGRQEEQDAVNYERDIEADEKND